MIQADIFRNSTLEMSSVPISGTDAVLDWSSLLTNRILVIVAILGILSNIPNFVRIGKYLLNCIFLARANATLEHSFNLARMRDQVAWASLIPLALLADRFGCIHPAIFDALPPVWRSLLTLGALLAFLTVRHILFLCLKPRRLNTETSATVHNIFYTFTIVLAIIALVSAGILQVFNAGDEVIRNVLLCETGLVWLLSLIRTGQIFGTHCGGFSTFLYLCALEILPFAGLVFCAAAL